MARIRQDVWKLNSGWNETLLWYARAIQALQALPLTDRRSWRFLGAIHGFNETMWRDAGLIAPGEAVPPEMQAASRTYGDQCQHQSWYFLPWHRGYLCAFENIIGAQVVALGGPDDWALPYWNYFDVTNPQAKWLPDAFTFAALPDGSPNPLFLSNRANNILVPSNPQRDIHLNAMLETNFLVGLDGEMGFGGPATGFNRGRGQNGDLEANPHNGVHVMLGGYMGNSYFAGLDPIFWLHHCNIDRLWEAWMNASHTAMTNDADWLDGPNAPDRRFIMPSVDGSDPGEPFTARDTLSGGKFYPEYDDLWIGAGIFEDAAAVSVLTMGSSEDQSVELIGASTSSVAVTTSLSSTQVNIDSQAANVAVATMGAAEDGEETSRLYLRLEGIRSPYDSGELDVFVNLPEGADPEASDRYRAGVIFLFGMAQASDVDGGHGGNGLTFNVEITDIVQRLSAAGEFDPNHVDVSIIAIGENRDAKEVSVERISVYKRTGIVAPPG